MSDEVLDENAGEKAVIEQAPAEEREHVVLWERDNGPECVRVVMYKPGGRCEFQVCPHGTGEFVKHPFSEQSHQAALLAAIEELANDG